ncbi:biotin/lipoyl-containing protein [Streptomyces avidinii]|nr:biotin/lipoyl-containing protein [Streptomyces avidinii]
MPSLGADMDEGTLVEWLVGPGDTVTKGDVVAVVETAKSTIEVECFDSGTVGALLIEPGTTVPVGTRMAVIDSGAEPPAAAPASCLSPCEAAAGPDLRTASRSRTHHHPDQGRRVHPFGEALGRAEGHRPVVRARFRQGRSDHTFRRGAHTG